MAFTDQRTALYIILGLVAACLAQAQDTMEWDEFCYLQQPRHHHKAAYIGNGKVLVIGGLVDSDGMLTSGTPTNTTEIIDVYTGDVTYGPSMIAPRSVFTIEQEPNGNLLVLGGGSTLVERFDVSTMRFDSVGQLTYGAWQQASAWISDSTILVVGGWLTSEAQIFNVSTGKSKAVAAFPNRANSMHAVMPVGRRASFWGYRTEGENSERYSFSYFYDTESDSWKQDLDFGVKLANPTTTMLTDGRSVLTGGIYSEVPVRCSDRVFVVDATGRVTTSTKLLANRAHHGAVEWLPGTLLIAGGMTDDAMSAETAEFCNVLTSVSVAAPTMLSKHIAAPLLMVPTAEGQAALMIAGHTGDGNSSIVEILRKPCQTPTTTQVTTFALRGSARSKGSAVCITNATANQAGSAWVPRPLRLDAGWTIDFAFSLDSGSNGSSSENGPTGAGGIALVFQNDAPTSLGSTGSELGYGGMRHGLALEFDSYSDEASLDPMGSHVALQLDNGEQLSAVHHEPFLQSIVQSGIPDFVADGSTYYGRVAYAANLLDVFIGKTANFKAPCLSVQINIPEALGLKPMGTAYVGVTASTGTVVQSHTLEYLTISGCDLLVSATEFEQPQSRPRFTASPSPTYGPVTLRFSEAVTGTITVHDISGTTMLSTQIYAENEVVLSTANLPMGTYLLLVAPTHGQYYRALLHIVR